MEEAFLLLKETTDKNLIKQHVMVELGAGNTVDGTYGHHPPEKTRKKEASLSVSVLPNLHTLDLRGKATSFIADPSTVLFGLPMVGLR